MNVVQTLSYLLDVVFFSASNAIKGEGLQEGLDWLQGTV